ncbi:MAG: OpgC domain-containing protein [Chloroflexi bacterium]|nr:OpgC domain-containing protein [Chloroflexota bacterium]
MAVATFPQQPGVVRRAAQALDGMLHAMRYVATPFGRDPRLDLLRGFCVFAMIVDHIGGVSWLYWLTGGNTGPVTAAEGFVFLSGLVLGIVSRRRIEKNGLRAAVITTLRRALTLYLLTVVLTLVFLGLTVGTSLALWVDRSLLGEVESWPALIGAVAAVRFTWNGTDILALYALLLAAAPLALVLLSAGRALPLLVASWALWLGYQVLPETLVVPWHIEHATTFPFAAWQALFISALTLGYHRRELSHWLTHESQRPTGAGLVYRAGLGAAACGLLLLAASLTPGQAYAATATVLPLTAVDLFDKASLGVGRILTFAVVAVAVYGGLTLFWRPIERLTGWLLIPLGQVSLYAYTVHLFLILAAYNVPPYVGSPEAGWELHNTVGQLLLVLILWAMVKRKVLFSLIPR